MAEDFEVGGPLPEERSNRPFVIAAVGIGALLVLSMICLALYALILAPSQQIARATEAANIILQNTQVAQSITETALAEGTTPTATPTETRVPTSTATPTRVVVLPSDTPTATPAATLDPLTATAAAQATISALAQAQTPSPTALPSTGFAEDAGIPNLLLVGGILLLVIVVARRLRANAPA
jgi:cytoskeletal protein RodZ